MVELVVTGVGGRLGGMIARAWRAAPPEGVRVLWCGRGPGWDIGWDILSGPVPDWPRGAVVLHLAAVVRGPADAFARNPEMAERLAEACRRNGARALLAASTIAVYGPGRGTPFDEDMPLDPQNDYGRSKAEAERRMARAAGGLPVTALRIGNVLGADALFGPRPSAQPIRLDPVPGSAAGPLRSWIGPRGLARAFGCLARLAGRGAALPPALNIACDPPLGMADLLEAAGRDWSWSATPAAVPVAVMSTRRLRALCPMPPTDPGALLAELAEDGG
ncbi:NAD-dependent epimerase/dehydratase family protein [Pseudogemmobacter sonorensis]|uniref:NAD-dependent epimerase/dehydratase family protein n=1 Tax=Pseudogemmobacter sonorensis TaxID=2989681 RepID=UPI0036823DDB